MNNTTKAKYELARKMIKGKIDIDEVYLMTGIDKAELEKLKEEIDPAAKEAKMFQDLDNTDLNIGEILFDNNETDDRFDENY